MALKDKIIDKAQKFVQKGNLDKAIAEYRAVVEMDPKDIAIRLRLGELYVKLNRTADAIREYSEAAKVNTQKGFYLKAIAVYKQILKLDDNLDIHHKLADLYTKQRLIADAVSEYSQIAAIFERKGKNNEVLELLRKMLDIDPDNIGIKLRLADLYHKLSFEKDAIAEYESIFGMLIAQGKADKAEKVYLGLYNSNPKEPVVLKGLSGLYAKKNDSAKFLKFAVPLFHIYRETDDTDAAREISAEILRFKPDDPDCVEFLKRPVQKEPEPLAAPPKSAGTETAAVDEVTTQAPESWTEDRGGKAGTEAPVVEQPVESQLEDEIEITLEGFDDTAREEAEAGPEPGRSAVEEAVAPHAAPVEAREEAEAEIDIGDLEEEELKASAAPVEEERPVEPAANIEITGNEPFEAGGAEAVSEPLTEAEEAAAGPEEINAEEAGGAEAVLEPLTEAEEASAAPVEEERPVEPVAKIEITGNEPVEAGGAEAVLEPLTEAEEAAAGPEAISAEPIDELLEAGLEEAIEEVNVKISEAEERQPVQPPGEAVVLEESAEVIEERIEALLRDGADESVPADIFEGMEPTSPPASTASGEQETESAEAVREASEAVAELIEKIGPEEMLVEPEGIRMEEVPDEGRSEDYVDLSAELGMEETVKDMAGSWSGGDSKEAYDEFKSGISQQLSREDTETHYNLGIAYMEMELYGEASKEFKIALKDPHLEFDCLTRLGLCSMAEGAPSEAVPYYTRGLKLEGRSDSERMGMMYELALAYEAAGDKENAGRIFNSIYDANPEYRDVAKKIPLAVPGQGKKNRIPLDDGMIEVELL